MPGADPRMRRGSRMRPFAARSLVAVTGVAMLCACGRDSPTLPEEQQQLDGTEVLLRAFDALCVATRFDEGAFHASAGFFGDAVAIPEDFLHMISPNHTAGYYLSDSQGDQVAAVMGLTRSDDIESRNCGITSPVGFDDAKALVSNRFPVELVDQFDQGTSEFAVFQGNLVGYAGNMAISVQGGSGLTTVSIYELPEDW